MVNVQLAGTVAHMLLTAASLLGAPAAFCGTTERGIGTGIADPIETTRA